MTNHCFVGLALRIDFEWFRLFMDRFIEDGKIKRGMFCIKFVCFKSFTLVGVCSKFGHTKKYEQ